ncbi:MAG TPA: TadE/TadG family type IV pilus assembly protein [Stellaceae bacterium]|nr:TadE/TadG family type IV pilus assembly protein [Stellaceae bacterium]
MLSPGGGARVRRARLWRANRGAAAIETAILLPLLFAFLLGIEELGRLLWIQSVLQYACEYAARYAAIPANSSDAGSVIVQYAQNHVFGMTSGTINFTYSSATTTPASQCGGPEVSATYTFQSVVPINQLLGLAGINALNGIELRAQSCLPSA